MIVRRLRGAIARAVLKEASDGSKESEGTTAPVQRERTDCRYMSLGAGCGRQRPEDHFLPLYSGVFSHARVIVRLIAQRFLPWSTPACALPGVWRRAATTKSTVLGIIARMVIGRGEQERSEGHTLAADNSYPTRLSHNALRRLYLNRTLIPAVCPFSSCAFPT